MSRCVPFATTAARRYTATPTASTARPALAYASLGAQGQCASYTTPSSRVREVNVVGAESVDAAVVGAGVVGLAVASELSRRGRSVVVLESAHGIGTETSSRNSEVIHAGIYYAKDSVRAKVCVPGKKELYRYCEERGIGHERTGKLIVATTSEQLPALRALIDTAALNGVDDLTCMEPSDVAAVEPHIHCTAALSSPSSGIVDSHGVMVNLHGDAEDNGAVFAFNSVVLGGSVRATDGRIALNVADSSELVSSGGVVDVLQVDAATVVNASGLGAHELAYDLLGSADGIPPLLMYKGSYYNLPGPSPFNTLIYPLPNPTVGLGIHVTLDLGGGVRFGPDLESVEAVNYDVDPRRADVFYDAVRTYYPGLEDGVLTPAYAGIRPCIEGNDFLIHGSKHHGVRGLVNLLGIQSPGLTACLALGRLVSEVVEQE